jgi:hypothetical protein
MRHDIILMVGKSSPKLIPKGNQVALAERRFRTTAARCSRLMLAKITTQESARVQGTPVAGNVKGCIQTQWTH